MLRCQGESINPTSLFEKWGLNIQSMAPSVRGYYSGLFLYFLSRPLMASSNSSLRGLFVSTAKYLSFFIRSVSMLVVTFFRAI